MKVEITESTLRSDGYLLVEGDRITVPDAVGRKWCRHGWAKDVDGKIPTGERRVIDASVLAEDTDHTQDASEVA